MPDIVPLRERLVATPAQAAEWEMNRVRRRLEAVEAKLDAPRLPAFERRPPMGGMAGRFLPVMAGMAVAALVLIAGSLFWQVTHPVPPGQPTVVVNTPPPVIQNNAQGNTQGGTLGGTQASTQMPSFRSPGIILPPRPVLRSTYPRG